MATSLQRISLKIAVGLTAIVPLTNGILGILKGPSMIERTSRYSLALDSHYRYMSGLPLGLGILLLRSLSKIEYDGSDLYRVTFLIFVGGLGRLYGLFRIGYDRNSILLTVSELFVLPLLCICQNRIQNQSVSLA